MDRFHGVSTTLAELTANLTTEASLGVPSTGFCWAHLDPSNPLNAELWQGYLRIAAGLGPAASTATSAPASSSPRTRSAALHGVEACG